jgi:hypothetical protein
MTIIDMNGKLVESQKLVGTGPYSIGANLQPGVYLLELWDQSSRQIIKFLKL